MKTHSVEVKLFHADERMDTTLFSVSRYSRENSTIKGLVSKKVLKVKMCIIWTLRYEILM
jgi:hypothetical protein